MVYKLVAYILSAAFMVMLNLSMGMFGHKLHGEIGVVIGCYIATLIGLFVIAPFLNHTSQNAIKNGDQKECC